MLKVWCFHCSSKSLIACMCKHLLVLQQPHCMQLAIKKMQISANPQTSHKVAVLKGWQRSILP